MLAAGCPGSATPELAEAVAAGVLVEGPPSTSQAVSGLPSNAFHDYVQYESVTHTHKGQDREWSHSGTNGFTSRMVASG